jgi:uncharacterized membrane protein
MIHCKTLIAGGTDIIFTLANIKKTLLNQFLSMESSENYDFSIFKPRNVHGKKNRNVIFSMLLIWAVAVFGFQFLLRAVEKPVQEEALVTFEKLWPSVQSGQLSSDDARSFLNSLIMARGKGTLNADEQKVLSDAISTFTSQLLPPELKPSLAGDLAEAASLRLKLQNIKDQEYLDTKKRITEISNSIVEIAAPFTGIERGTLEAAIFTFSLKNEYPASMNDKLFEGLAGIMKLYMTHNRSFLTDTNFLGFPLHYFYTAVFLLILFVGLCIVYNKLIEWRLKKEGVVE